MLVEVAAHPLRRLSKQPLDAETQTHENSKQQQDLDPPAVSKICRDEADGSPELVRQIGDRSGECDDVLADRADTGVEIVRGGIRHGFRRCSGRGLCLALLFQPFLNLGIGEQIQQLVDLCRCCRPLFARRWRSLLSRRERAAYRHCREDDRDKAGRQDLHP